MGDVCVAEFEDSATESAEAAAKRWIDAPSNQKKWEPAPKAEHPKTAAPESIEHVKIDCTDVKRRGLDQHPSFLRLYGDMQNSFGDRKYGYEVALHEAAHAVLMEQDGLQNVRFTGPDIIYDVMTRQFKGSSARTIADDMPDAIMTDDFIFMITVHMVAGRMGLEKLAGIKGYKGDEGDYDDFLKKYTANPPASGDKPEDWWKRACDRATERLTEPATKAKVLARADEYLGLLYPKV